ncbi:helix-turn-helix transcriptional regulator [Epibacterium ulvae]|uniref:helix-turn-helix domain-containing protein n=1 Tax=Epibacterium ulvae TaxID=1156985 RepID=UPI001BFC1B97|nr:helix-turn-helix transcriptional regulator [Epibacterium ulvae]MBT8155162.1 helix-turn-helix transcriptional regulator [Epibacterium ulvae]
MQLDPKSRKAARFVSRLQRTIQQALIASGMTQQQVAEALSVNRSVINKRLKGNANLTARSIAEFAYVFDKDIEIKFVDRTVSERSNVTTAINKVIHLGDHQTPTGTANPCREFTLESAAS